MRTLPSQVPPQSDPSVAHGGRCPRGSPVTALQVPWLPVTLHASHWPVQSESQQKPSTQRPPAHSLSSLLHACPVGFLATHTPAAQ
jgi:hypothetical protein